jgi:hypothetical protein
MTMLMHTRDPFERTSGSSAGRKRVRTGLAAIRPATIKRFCVRALAVLAAMGALAGIIALEAVFYLSRLNY